MGLIETVARAICLNRAAPACKCKDDGICKAPAENLLTESNERLSQARAAVLAVLEFYSEPSNVTDEAVLKAMAAVQAMVWPDGEALSAYVHRANKVTVAAAMRAARDEVSRDK